MTRLRVDLIVTEVYDEPELNTRIVDLNSTVPSSKLAATILRAAADEIEGRQ